MKIVSWNVNGLRASVRNYAKTLKDFLDSLDADIICLQETKATRDQLDELTYSADGYNGYFSFCRTRPGYSGVVTFCRDAATPLTAEEGLTGILSRQREDTVKFCGCTDSYTEEELMSLDAEGRSVLTEHQLADGGSLVIANMYCPMVDKGPDNQTRMNYKIKFYSVLKARCEALEKAGKSVLVVGDLNLTREIKDSSFLQEDPSLFKESHPPRQCMEHFIVSTKTAKPAKHSTVLLDTFRYVNPMADKAFTCWSTMLDCRKTNYGTRIDYILCSMTLSDSLSKAEVWQSVYGSDHCPVFAEFTLSLIASSVQPSLSSSYFSFGKQKKMSDFFVSSAKDYDPPPTKKQKTVPKPPSTKTLLSFMEPLPRKQQKPVSKEVPQAIRDSNIVSPDKKPTINLDKVSSDFKMKSNQSTVSERIDQEASQKSSSGLASGWQDILTGPPKAPPCQRHQEPCVLRTVKKQGLNLNRQFWVCARPLGSKNDPAARCDYFKWIKKK